MARNQYNDGAWSEEEVLILKENRNIPRAELEKKLPKRTWTAIKKKMSREGISRSLKNSKGDEGMRWTDKEEEILKKNYKVLSMDKLDELLPERSIGAIKSKAKRMKLERKAPNDINALETNFFFDEVEKRLKEKQKKLTRPANYKKPFKGKIKEMACLLISDVHIGKTNYWVNENTGLSEVTYNLDVCKQEVNNLLSSIEEINNLLSGGYDIEKLHIFGLGDLLDNDIIFRGQKWFVDIGAGMQFIEAVDIFSYLIRELLGTFKEIEITFVGGNHGRVSSRAKEAKPFYNSWSYILGSMLKKVFINEKRVSFVLPQSWFFRKEIGKWHYFLHHGNTVHSWMGFPYYGISRQGKSRRMEMDIDIECIGHFHRVFNIPISSDSITLVNGCWIPKDDYSWQKYGYITRPKQIYFGISPKRPKTWKFDLELDKRG